MDANGDRSTVGLVASDSVDMDDPLLTVDLGDFALPALVLAAHDTDFVVLANGKGTGLNSKENSLIDVRRVGVVRDAHVVLGTEVLCECRGHDLTPHGRRCGEVRLARLAARRRNVCTPNTK